MSTERNGLQKNARSTLNAPLVYFVNHRSITRTSTPPDEPWNAGSNLSNPGVTKGTLGPPEGPWCTLGPPAELCVRTILDPAFYFGFGSNQ